MLNIRVVGSTIQKAVDAYNNGDPNKASAIIVASTSELAISIIGGSVLTSAIATYFTGLGVAVGGPIGAGIGAILAGVIGYGVADFVGSGIGDAIMDWFGLSDSMSAPRVDPLVR
ncbi:MAG: hypothetical protein WBI07_14115 [Mobilitalea sp.]